VDRDWIDDWNDHVIDEIKEEEAYNKSIRGSFSKIIDSIKKHPRFIISSTISLIGSALLTLFL